MFRRNCRLRSRVHLISVLPSRVSSSISVAAIVLARISSYVLINDSKSLIPSWSRLKVVHPFITIGADSATEYNPKTACSSAGTLGQFGLPVGNVVLASSKSLVDWLSQLFFCVRRDVFKNNFIQLGLAEISQFVHSRVRNLRDARVMNVGRSDLVLELLPYEETQWLRRFVCQKRYASCLRNLRIAANVGTQGQEHKYR